MLVVNSSWKTSSHTSAIIKSQRQVELLKACGWGRWYNARIFLGSVWSLWQHPLYLQSLRKLKVIFLLILPNHEESDFLADAKDSNFTLLAEKKKGGIKHLIKISTQTPVWELWLSEGPKHPSSAIKLFSDSPRGNAKLRPAWRKGSFSESRKHVSICI